LAMLESLYFIYDNINFYEQFGIINCHIQSGLFEENFLANREIIEEKIRGRYNPYFIEIQEYPLELKLSFAFYDGFDKEKLNAVARALKKKYYCPLIFSENLDRIFYAICVDNPQLIHTGLGTGYIELTFRCNSPYVYSPVYISNLYDLSSNIIDGTEITLINNGDMEMFSILTIQVINSGDFSIVKKSDGGKLFSMTDLSDNETITIDTENENIQSDIPLTYRYDNMTLGSEFLTFPRGVNKLQIYGNIKLQVKYEYRFLI